MASQRMIFLVAILLTVAIGCNCGRICHTNKDCPPCKVGKPLCADGLCTCLDIKTDDDAALEKRSGRCNVDKDCAKLCKPGCPPTSYNCVNNICFCAC